MIPPKIGPVHLPAIAQADVKPTASPLLEAGTESISSASAANIEITLTAPFRNRMTRREYQVEARPVKIPKTQSPANPHRISLFRPM
jgi:hypothetical protein